MSADEKRVRGERLKALRLALGFRTQEDLADASPDGRILRTYVNRAENGKNALTGELLLDFAETMHFHVRDLATYLEGTLELPALLARRIEDPKTGDFFAALKAAPKLREWLDEHPNDLALSELVRGLAIYREHKPRGRSDGQPLMGWGGYFRDALAGKLTTQAARGTGTTQAAIDLEAGQNPGLGGGGLQTAKKKR